MTFFQVVCKTTTANTATLISTYHNEVERCYRNTKIRTILGGYGKGLFSFVVDENHPKGLEIHTITDNGLVLIQNAQTGRLVTTLIARRGQLVKYFDRNNLPSAILPVLKLAEKHEFLGYNNW